MKWSGWIPHANIKYMVVDRTSKKRVKKCNLKSGILVGHNIVIKSCRTVKRCPANKYFFRNNVVTINYED